MRALPPLEEIGFGWRSHGAALRWWGLALTRPRTFEVAVEVLRFRQRPLVAAALFFHVAPWFVAALTIGQWLQARHVSITQILGAIGLLTGGAVSGAMPAERLRWGPRRWLPLSAALLLIGFAMFVWSIRLETASTLALLGPTGGFAFGLGFGLVFGLAFGLAFGLCGGLVGSLAVSLAFGLSGGFGRGLLFGLAFGLASGLARVLVVGLAVSLALGLAVTLAVGLARGVGVSLGVAVGLVFGFSRLPYLLAHLSLLLPRPRGHLYPRHPVAWDDCCHLPFPGLHRLLVAYHAVDPDAATREIDRLIDEYPAQRGQAIRAKETLVARRACMLERLTEIDDVLASLPERPGKRGDETRRIKELAHEITEAAARLETASRIFLRDPYSQVLLAAIDRFHEQMAGVSAPLRPGLRVAARRWKAIAERDHQVIVVQRSRKVVRQPFRAGDPVDRSQEAFVPRLGPIGEVEAQLALATGCPGLLIYGRRRTGKTTLIKNLSGFVGSKVAVGYVSMLGARASGGIESLTEVIGDELRGAASTLHQLPDPGLVELERLLGAADQRLSETDRRLVLAIDEFENLDRKIGEGVFGLDLLGMIRESIQNHRRIVWCFAGSHAVEELEHADWSSYLVSARTIELPFFSPEETRLLLTEPFQTSPLWKDADASRPRFAPSFWGEGGIEHIHSQTAGWPHLVQLLAENAVDLVNETSAAAVDPALLDKAADRAVERGHLVFRQLLEKECRAPAEWDYLYAFRRQETQPPPDDPAIERSLRRRLLVSEEGDRWRLRVPLMARWLRKRA